MLLPRDSGSPHNKGVSSAFSGRVTAILRHIAKYKPIGGKDGFVEISLAM